MVYFARFALVATLVASAGCAVDAGVGRTDAPVIYGVDDRTDVYAHPDPALQALARQSIVALFLPQDLDETDPANVVPDPTPLSELFGVCEDAAFASQPAASNCSGTLIAPDLVVTVGHCVDSEEACERMRVVFDYYYAAEGELETIEADDVYRCAERVSYSLRYDNAVIRLDRPAVGRTPAPVRPGHFRLAPGDPVTIIGFGSGLPAKIDDGGEILRDGIDERRLLATTDSFAGNSGSGIFDADGRLVALLSSGETDYVPGPSGCNVPYVIDDPGPGEGETLVYGWAAMHELCRRSSEPTLCADPTSWCPDCGGGGGCAVAPGRPGGGVATALLLVVALLALPRRRLRRA